MLKITICFFKGGKKRQDRAEHNLENIVAHHGYYNITAPLEIQLRVAKRQWFW